MLLASVLDGVPAYVAVTLTYTVGGGTVLIGVILDEMLFVNVGLTRRVWKELLFGPPDIEFFGLCGVIAIFFNIPLAGLIKTDFVGL